MRAMARAQPTAVKVAQSNAHGRSIGRREYSSACIWRSPAVFAWQAGQWYPGTSLKRVISGVLTLWHTWHLPSKAGAYIDTEAISESTSGMTFSIFGLVKA